MIEIGDGFRLPELLESTGARLREVGTTNRTTVADYAGAAGPRTAFVLKVHPSNYRIEGFTRQATIAELTAPGGFCARQGVPVVADMGSGLLRPDPLLPDEPDATTALRDGAALVTASGDKLLGAPQAGLLLGRPALVETLRRHPLARALRVGKLTLAALEATVRGPRPPTAQALHTEPAVLRRRAKALAGGLPAAVAAAVALPGRYEAALLAHGIIGRIERGRLLLDLRAVDPGDDARLGDIVRTVLVGIQPASPA